MPSTPFPARRLRSIGHMVDSVPGTSCFCVIWCLAMLTVNSVQSSCGNVLRWSVDHSNEVARFPNEQPINRSTNQIQSINQPANQPMTPTINPSVSQLVQSATFNWINQPADQCSRHLINRPKNQPSKSTNRPISCLCCGCIGRVVGLNWRTTRTLYVEAWGGLNFIISHIRWRPIKAVKQLINRLVNKPQSTHHSINQSIDDPIDRSINHFTHQWINHSSNQPTKKVNHSIHQPTD